MEQTITLQLPDEVLRRYQRGATAARKVLEEFLADRLADLAPPLVDNLPSPLREELRDLEKVSDPALRQVAQSRLPAPRQRAYSHLLRKQSQGTLRPREGNPPPPRRTSAPDHSPQSARSDAAQVARQRHLAG